MSGLCRADVSVAGLVSDRTLYTRWRAISFLARVRYKDQVTPDQPAAFRASRPSVASQ